MLLQTSTIPLGDWVSLVGLVGAATVAVSTFIWSMAWWLSKQFTHMKSAFYEKIDRMETKIIEKLEYHERHDDQRFLAMNNEIWNIKVRNAARDGYTINSNGEPKRKVRTD